MSALRVSCIGMAVLPFLASFGCAASNGSSSGQAGASGASSNQAGATSSGGYASSTGGASSVTGGSSATTGGASGTTGGTSGTTGGTSGTTGGTSGTTGGTSGSTGGGSGQAGSGGIIPAEGCQSSQAPGTWVKITPATMKMSGDFIDGPIAANVDPVKTSDIYVQAQYDGTWKSTDCGVTWKKVSTGTNGNAINNGRQWYAAIDPNPKRDPKTPPTLYTTLGYGSGGIWKSTNGGVDWANVWTDNIYGSDGTTNISKDVGGDVSGVAIASKDGPNHLIAFLHSYWGSGNNNGVFESTDGGGRWKVHVSSSFAFQAHGDVVFPYDDSIWVVGAGQMFRTTDAGSTWGSAGNTGTAAVGRAWWIIGDTIYAGSDFWGAVFKSSDRGASWKSLAGSRVSWVVATGENLYASDAVGNGPPHILHASLANDTKWTDDGNPSGMTSGGSRATVTFDGQHYVLIAAQEMGGLWRYVEP